MIAAEAGPSASGPYLPRAPLVNQVDAGELDDGIAALLGDGVERAFSRFHVPLPPHKRADTSHQ